ncbi:ATP-dependent DNA ligase [Rhodococcus opacus]|uniref:ATP-dependent DNA ligase n=1 Tax=Rhodococcus opacus TaxID=37919 RepID=UPI00211DF91B|nr:hypothetical protein [Rhodococcus opacus]
MDGGGNEVRRGRVVAAVGGGESAVLWTRNLNVVTSSYPELAEGLTDVFGGRGRIVFDGEVVALAQGRPSFARLQKRMNTLRPTTAARRQVPVTNLPFDVLSADGGDLMAASYLERRAALSTSVTSCVGSACPCRSCRTGRQFRDGGCGFQTGGVALSPGSAHPVVAEDTASHEELLLDCWLDRWRGCAAQHGRLTRPRRLR